MNNPAEQIEYHKRVIQLESVQLNYLTGHFYAGATRAKRKCRSRLYYHTLKLEKLQAQLCLIGQTALESQGE